MIAARVDVNSRSARHVTKDAVIDGGLTLQCARPLQPVHQNRIAEADLDDLVEVFENRVKFFRQVETRRHVVGDAARRKGAGQERLAGGACVQWQSPYEPT